MTRDKCLDVALHFYEEITRLTTGRTEYELRQSSMDKVMMQKWLDYVDKTYGLVSVGESFILNWVESSFNYWVEERKADKIYLNWIFGKKAIDRYEWVKEKDNKLNHFLFRELKYRFLMRKELSFQESRKRLKGLSITEERYKKHHLNEREGMVWCGTTTTLYNHLSEHCMVCVHNVKCKETLIYNYPKIAKLRGYATK